MSDALAQLKVVLGADISDYEKKLDAVTKTQVKMGKDLEKIGKELSLKLTAPILATAAAFTMMAASEEAADFRMAASLRNIGVSYQTVDKSVHKLISSLEDLTVFNDTDLQNSFTDLINITRNYEASLKALPIAADLARATGMDLSQATMLVGKAFNGNTTALQRFGVKLQEGAKGMAVLDELHRRFAGSAEAYGKSTEGVFARMRNSLENAAEAWGKTLLPVANTFMNLVIKLAGYVTKVAEAFGNLSPATKAVVIAVVAAVAAFGPLVLLVGKLMVLWPALVGLFSAAAPIVAAVAAKVLLLGGAALVIIANWENVKRLFNATLLGIGVAINMITEKVLSFLAFLTQKVPGVGAMFKDMAAKASTAANEMELKFLEASGGIKGPMEMLGNTSQWLKDKFNEMAQGIGLASQSIPDNTIPALQETATFMQKFTALMKKESEDMAKGVLRSFASMSVGIATALATGTGDAWDILMNFLIRTFESIAEWAIANALIMSAMGEALQESFGNPYVAAGIAIAMVALAAGLKASLQKHNQAALATGGMTTGITSAIIGDNPSHKEVVMPLDSPVTTRALSKAMPEGGMATGSTTAIIEVDGREVARAIIPHLPQVMRLQAIGD